MTSIMVMPYLGGRDSFLLILSSHTQISFLNVFCSRPSSEHHSHAESFGAREPVRIQAAFPVPRMGDICHGSELQSVE